MEADIVHCSPMAGELMQQLPGARFPYCHTLIPTARRNPLALRVPACFEEVPLLPCRCAVVREDPSVCWSERSDVPRANGGIVRVGQ